ncbi:hypothetical protein DE146DRAFT_452152 [Phaeosphaeria sp. MPI-PUGE-AT-0046c]|nr:hypothetical protein DE146DRAFT_452152 [Phaeosphaeria sp. MPI-PUGE-AT-0046c]
MSAEQFSKLSLGESMVTTRAAAARAGRTSSGSSSGSSEDQPIHSIENATSNTHTPTPSLVISTNNLQYNVSTFNKDLRRRVELGVEDNEIKMKYCTLSTDQDDNGLKHFYLDEDITVSVGGELLKPKCSCGANEKGIACKHIYWLADQILSTAPEYLDEKPVQFSPDGSTVQSTTPVEILNSKGLESIADDRKWVLQKQEIPEDEIEMKDEITSMLSVFEPQEALPGEFKTPESLLATERSRRYRRFAKLCSDYALRDPGLFLQIREIINPGFQCRVFFEKINSRTARAFHALDEYIAYGPQNASRDTLMFDVPSCAVQLRNLVDTIDDFCCEQDKEDPESRVVARGAAAALMTILDRVVDRNVNAYESISWGLEAPSNSSENNLFVALIGSQTEDDNSLFVLDTLQSLPQEDVLRSHWEMLQSIEQKLADADTPAVYQNAFRRFVHDSRKRATSERREGEPKRAMQE